MVKYKCKNCGKCSYTSSHGQTDDPCIYCGEVMLEETEEEEEPK